VNLVKTRSKFGGVVFFKLATSISLSFPRLGGLE